MEEVLADQTGSNQLPSTEIPDKGYLPQEPCRRCHRVGGVCFVIDDSSFGKNSPQVMSCDFCKYTWTADGPLA